MLISKTIGIEMGHRVPNHKSKCRNFHGHHYQIEVGVDDKVIEIKGTSDEGMVIDFSDLKEIIIQEIDNRFDHGFVMSTSDDYYPLFCQAKFDNQKIIFTKFIPTAENLAKHWYQLLKSKLKQKNIKLSYVKVWETPTSTATYEEN